LHNPTAIVMPEARRRDIAAVARRHGVLLIEDDVFGFLVPDAPPPFQRLAPDITLHVNSVSKSIAGGLRVGYLAAPPALVPRLESLIRSLTYTTPPLMAEIVTRWIRDGTADRFADGQRMEALARHALARAALGDTISSVPGQHVWMTLPAPWRGEEFVAECHRRGVLVTGADAFVVGRGAAPHAIRLGLCMPARRDDLQRGLDLIAGALALPEPVGMSIV
jgi:DNA-binding transcriptional MocR family regulator